MKRRILCLAAVLLQVCIPAMAQNVFDRVIRRYKPAPVTLPETAQDRLQALIREGTIPLSITDLINLTLENNLDVRVNRLNPLSSEYAIWTNYRPFEPTLNLGASLTRDSSRSRTQLTGVGEVSQLSHAFNIGYAQTLRTGSDITVDFILNRTSSNNAFNTFNPSWFGQMRYSFTQRLLNGFGRSVNSRGIRIAQNNKTISEVQFETMVIDLVSQAESNYWDLVFTSEDIKVKQASLALAEKTFNDNQRQVDIGTMARIDLVQARSQVASRKEGLIVSTFSQVQIQDQVKKVLSRSPDPGLVFAKIAPTQVAGLPDPSDTLPPEQAIKVALENRPELRQAKLRLNNSDIELEYARNQLLPSLDFSASYTQNGVGGTETIRSGFGSTAPIVSVNPGGLGDALSELLKSRSGGYTVGFNMRIPLSNRAQQAEYSRVVVEKRTVEEDIKSIEQRIALEVRNALTAVDMNKARIEAAQSSRELAQEQLSAEQRKFELGASTIRIVLEEQTNLEQMQTNEIAALVNYRKALVEYDRALGVTLKKNNVSIEKAVALK
jgi:outer membrane protein